MSDTAATTFRPWRRDYIFGVVLSLSGIAFGLAAALTGKPWIAVFLSGWCAYRGHMFTRRGALRERGIEVETNAIDKLRSELLPRGYLIRSDITFGQYGNVDVVVSPPWSAARFVIEIKSFDGIIKRGNRLTRPRRFFPLWGPLRQVRNQCYRLGNREHFPVLWMPESTLDTHFVFQDVLVVNGGVHRLEAALRLFEETIPRDVVVTFPNVPPDMCREMLKRLSFRYNGDAQQWTGRLNKSGGESLAAHFSTVGGRVEMTP